MTDPFITYRVNALETLFRQIADTRMAGLPVINGALRVEAVGFEPGGVQPGQAPALCGILLTPWFMNLVYLPLAREDEPSRVGVKRRLPVGREHFEFIGAHEAAIGTFDACSLFSPMFDFADHAAARTTAEAVLANLRGAPVPASQPVAEKPEVAPSRPSRRGFLFGRGGAK